MQVRNVAVEANVDGDDDDADDDYEHKTFQTLKGKS